MPKVQDGMHVCFDYTLTLDNGEVIDSTEDRAPVCYVHGTGSIIPGLEKSLEGLSEGEVADVLVPAAEGYGELEPETVERLPRQLFPEEIEEGMGFRMRTESGQIVTVYAETISDEWVDVNFSHPLAGKDLHFNVQITGVREATEEDLLGEQGCGDGCGGCNDGCSCC